MVAHLKPLRIYVISCPKWSWLVPQFSLHPPSQATVAECDDILPPGSLDIFLGALTWSLDIYMTWMTGGEKANKFLVYFGLSGSIVNVPWLWYSDALKAYSQNLLLLFSLVEERDDRWWHTCLWHLCTGWLSQAWRLKSGPRRLQEFGAR